MVKKMLLFITLTVFSALYAMPQFSLQKVHDGYVIDFNLPAPVIEQVDVNERTAEGTVVQEKFWNLTMPGFSREGAYGSPLYLQSSFFLACEDQVPVVEISNVLADQIRLDAKLYPNQEPIPYCADEHGIIPTFRFNPASYQQRGESAPYASVIEEFTYRGQKAATIAVQPTSYDPQTNTLTVVKSMRVSLKMRTPSVVRSWNSEGFDKVMRNMFVNLDASVASETFSPMKYLVITGASYKDNEDVKKLVEFRKKGGYTVELVSTADVGGTTKDNFKTYITGKKPTFCLLAGSESDFPAHTSKVGQVSPNGWNYYVATGTLTGRPKPEIALGIFYVKDATQLKNAITKTIATETSLSSVPKVYVGHGGNTQQMSPSADHCDKIVLETFTNYFKSKSYTMKEIYSCSEPKFTQQTGGAEDVKQCNAGAHFMHYNGHGSPQGWNFGWKGSDVAKLTNTVYPFIMSCCCNSGDWFASGNLATMIIQSAKGATTIVAGNQVSYNGMHLFRGYFDAIMKQNITKGGLAYVTAVNGEIYPDYMKSALPTEAEKSMMGWQYHHFGDPGVETLNSSTTEITPNSQLLKSSNTFSAKIIKNSVIMNFSIKQNAVLSVYSLSGKQIFSTKVDAMNSQYSWNMKTNLNAHASTGIFVATLNEGNTVSKIKFEVVK